MELLTYRLKIQSLRIPLTAYKKYLCVFYWTKDGFHIKYLKVALKFKRRIKGSRRSLVSFTAIFRLNFNAKIGPNKQK